MKKDLKGEHNAREVSDALPFLEYEIHRQLVNKLKVFFIVKYIMESIVVIVEGTFQNQH